MAVDVVLQHGALEIAATHRLFAPLDGSYAVSADAQRFIAPAAPQQARVAPLTLVLNWPAALKN
jgi:hypothetical protein